MLKWIGHQQGVAGLPNIPARDLSEDEVLRFGGEKVLIATGLYEKTAKPKEAKPVVERYTPRTEEESHDSIAE